MIDILQSLYTVRRRKSGKGWSLSSNVELEEKFITRSLALSYEGEITRGPFMIVDPDTLPLLKNFLSLEVSNMLGIF